MKLRIKGDSLRLRVSPSEMRRLLQSGRVEETIHFAVAPDARLTYALEISPQASSSTPSTPLTVRYADHEVSVIVSGEYARAWANGDDVGMYGDAPTAGGSLEVAVEKDFACLDKGEADNADTFPNPHEGAVC